MLRHALRFTVYHSDSSKKRFCRSICRIVVFFARPVSLNHAISLSHGEKYSFENSLIKVTRSTPREYSELARRSEHTYRRGVIILFRVSFGLLSDIRQPLISIEAKGGL